MFQVITSIACNFTMQCITSKMRGMYNNKVTENYRRMVYVA